MKHLQLVKLLLLTSLTGVGVALTYFYFEAAVHHSTAYVWEDLFKTDEHRWLVVPLCIVLALIYFGVQHLLDRKSESEVSEGLGEVPSPTIVNYLKVLVIGFFSLLAGASLGPEAILVPACMILGSFIGVKLFDGKDKKIAGLFAIAGFIALFAAFFHSFVIGFAALLLVVKQFKVKPSVQLAVVAAVAAASTVITLGVLDGSSYVTLPAYTWSLNATELITLVLLGFAGYGTTYVLSGGRWLSNFVVRVVKKHQWWLRAMVAGSILATLYLLGGPLVQFTGNESIVPMLDQAAELGLVGLLGIFIVKILAISWSKTIGYRGGLIFPSVFVASVLVAIAQIFTSDLNFIYGLLVVMIGILAADSKVKMLL